MQYLEIVGLEDRDCFTVQQSTAANKSKTLKFLSALQYEHKDN